jgi:hypothetical protein
MSLDVTVTIQRGAAVLRLMGTADPADVAAGQASLAAAAGDARVVVVDLDGMTAAAPDGVRQLVATLDAYPRRVHLVARRNSMVTLLTRARIHHVVDVHHSVADAIAAAWAALTPRS